MTEAQIPEASAQPDTLATLRALLGEERSTAERLEAIADLNDSVADEATVHALCALVKTEKTLEVRRALLQLLLEIDLTRLRDRAPYIELMLHLCATEPEQPLRLQATRRLAMLAPDSPGLEELLVETLFHERSDAIHEAALVGLARRPDKSERTFARLIAYAELCPPGARQLLLELFKQMPRASAEAGLVAMLSPWEEPRVREPLLRALEEMPSLSAQAGQALARYLGLEPSRELRALAARILGALRDGGPELSQTLLAVLARAPDGAELLDALAHKLDSQPELIPLFAQMLMAPGPMLLKRKLLALLEKARAHGPLALALEDPNPWVRASAIEACARLLQQEPAIFAPALCKAAANEALTELRVHIAQAFAQANRLDEATQKKLVEWIAQEGSPRVSEKLAQALPGVAITDETRAPLLRAYLRVLRDPFAEAETVRAASERLRSFAYRDEPALIECLRELLARAQTRQEAEGWDVQLRKLAPDAKERLPLTRKLLHRFLGDYPAEPLATWSRELHSLAPTVDEVRAEIPQLVALTGETWMLSAADAAEKKSALLPTVRELLAAGKTTDAQRCIEEAWNQRTLRKSDLLALYRRLLADIPGEGGVFQAVVQILAKAKLATPEVQELSLEFLRRRPRSDMAYGVMQFLNEVAKNELGYGERVVASFNQASYSEFCRTGDDPQDAKEVPRTFNDWEYQGFRVPYGTWHLIDLFFELSRPADIHALLSAPPPADVAPMHALQALVLQQRWRKGEETAEELAALGKLAHGADTQAHAHLRDRALLLVWKRWKGYLKSLQGLAPPPELSTLAAETYLHLWDVRAGFGPETKEKAPEPLAEMDFAWVQANWKGSADVLKELQEKAFAAVNEARAKELLQLATAFSNKGKKAEALALLDRLVGPFSETKWVQQKREEIDAYRQKAS